MNNITRNEIAWEKLINILTTEIINTEECIIYPTINKDGYGIFQPTVKGRKYHFLMHRASYLFHFNNLKKEDIVCHTCDNPACINPKHLFKGTHNDNVQDKVNKGRQAKGNTHGKYIDGRASDNIKYSNYYANRSLSKIQVLAIKKLRQEGKTIKEISEELNINIQTIKDISCGRTYKDII